nr:hypothetical protein [Tanacetum cinerariifolium]
MAFSSGGNSRVSRCNQERHCHFVKAVVHSQSPDVRACAQELKRFEEIHHSTHPRSALAAAFALPAQGRCTDCVRRPVSLSDHGAVDLRSGRSRLEPHEQLGSGSERCRPRRRVLGRHPVHDSRLLRLHLSAVAWGQGLSGVPPSSRTVAVERLAVLLAHDRSGVSGPGRRIARASAFSFGVGPPGLGRRRAGRGAWRSGQARAECAGQHAVVHCAVPVRPDRLHRPVLVQSHGHDGQDNAGPGRAVHRLAQPLVGRPQRAQANGQGQRTPHRARTGVDRAHGGSRKARSGGYRSGTRSCARAEQARTERKAGAIVRGQRRGRYAAADLDPRPGREKAAQ